MKESKKIGWTIGEVIGMGGFSRSYSKAFGQELYGSNATKRDSNLKSHIIIEDKTKKEFEFCTKCLSSGYDLLLFNCEEVIMNNTLNND